MTMTTTMMMNNFQYLFNRSTFLFLLQVMPIGLTTGLKTVDMYGLKN